MSVAGRGQWSGIRAGQWSGIRAEVVEVGETLKLVLKHGTFASCTVTESARVLACLTFPRADQRSARCATEAWG